MPNARRTYSDLIERTSIKEDVGFVRRFVDAGTTHDYTRGEIGVVEIKAQFLERRHHLVDDNNVTWKDA